MLPGSARRLRLRSRRRHARCGPDGSPGPCECAASYVTPLDAAPHPIDDAPRDEGASDLATAGPMTHPLCPSYASKVKSCYPTSSADFLAECEYIYSLCPGVSTPAAVSCRLAKPCAEIAQCVGLAC
jgi:hypothetical protein